MAVDNNKRGVLDTIFSFFPLQLLIYHVKYNLLALLYWALIFMIITDNLGSSFGIPLLFFSPEYLGTVSIWSFLALGFAFGGFAIGFHTYSYIKLAPEFPFLASLDQPFFKFCVNNSTIPLIFSIVFIVNFSSFHIQEEYAGWLEVLKYITAYSVGFIFFHTISFLYFFPMNRRVTKSILDPLNEKLNSSVAKTVIPNKEKWTTRSSSVNDKSYLYIGRRFKIRSSRSNTHYKKELLTKIYEQNRINATIFETISLISFISLGLFREYPFFEFPAAVSVVLLLTIILMLFSSLLSWLKRWTYPVLILVFFIMNYMSTHTDFFTFRNYAYGLSYDKDTMETYDIQRMSDISSNEVYQHESEENLISILEKWKKRTGQKKPKLVIMNVSGGGSRSALWVLNCMQRLDQGLDFELSQHLQMITGASGGMVGAAYYREILHQYRKGEIENTFDSSYRENIAADMLNRLTFAASTNDIFFRYQHVEIEGNTYTKDRGYAFESQLHKNTKGILDVPLEYYAQPEQEALIPMMIFSPTIVNDGRRMLIGAQSLTALTVAGDLNSQMGRSFENIDYQKFFENSNPQRIRFSSVIRMSATFPFVMPMVTLPTKPEIQLMDAGIRDNYGGKVTMEYLHVFNDWISKNTSGVVILQIRDTKKVLDNETYRQVSLSNKISLPFGNIYKNFPRTQDFDQDQLIKLGKEHFNFPIDVVSFNLRENNKDKISLSWHLTTVEKHKVEVAIQSRSNRHSLERLKKLLEN
jgi:hypothetical protein